ncbi:MAG: FmdB family transcriptional regulator [Pyrinomonas sp.]|uniref:FmdB family zinc ribbon protein n=1 Tax=Pyrinomonas sp. TaxID=2080306 RepID=UPI00331DAAB2
MPIYEYRCKECAAHLEILQKINDAPLATCPECGGKLEKQWSLSGFQFKGSGWYVTDYARKRSAGGEKSDRKSEDQSRPDGEKAQSAATTTPARVD